MEDDEGELAMELEALEAIFADELEVVTEGDSSSTRVQIAVDDEDTGVRLRLVFTVSRGYPDVVPAIGVHADAGLSAPRRSELLKLLEETAEQNLSMPMLYSLHSAAKEWIEAELLDAAGESEAGLGGRADNGPVFETRDEEEERRLDAADEKKFRGTPVTLETFSEWKAKFDEEKRCEAAEEERKMADASREKAAFMQKLTGRELFLQNKAVVTEDAEALWEAEADQYSED